MDAQNAIKLRTMNLLMIKEQNAFAVIKKPTSWLYDDEQLQEKFMEVSYNTRLPVVSQEGGATQIATPSDGEKWISSEEIAVFQSEQDIPKPTGETLVQSGEQFLSLPYLWAGTSGFGFDCSGFHLYDLSSERNHNT